MFDAIMRTDLSVFERFFFFGVKSVGEDHDENDESHLEQKFPGQDERYFLKVLETRGEKREGGLRSNASPRPNTI